VKLDKLPTIFARVLGVSSFDNLERTSLAVSNTNMEVEVAPAAIPYCQLLLDTDVHVKSGNHLTKTYQSAAQQHRALVLTEANPKRDLLAWSGARPSVSKELVKRREGLTRFESFVRKPYVTYTEGKSTPCFDDPVSGELPSCKHLVLYGVLGRPSAQPGKTISPGDVSSLFRQAKDGKLKARLGDYFAPLAELEHGQQSISSADIAIGEYIKKDSSRFRSVFTIESSAGFMQTFKAKDSFPFLRTIRPVNLAQDREGRPLVLDEHNVHNRFYDLHIDWPTGVSLEDSNKFVWIKEIMDYQGLLPARERSTRPDGAWTNPLCHSTEVANLGNNLDQPVKRARVMVVAPTIDKYKYCDFTNVFSGQAQHAIPPIAESEPIIVGSVEVDLFDANVQNLSKNSDFVSRMNSYELPPIYNVFFRGTPFRKVVTPRFFGAPLDSTFPTDVVDRNPGELDVADNQDLDKALDRINSYKTAYDTCLTDPGQEEKGTDENGNPTTTIVYPECKKAGQNIQALGKVEQVDLFPTELMECFDMSSIFNKLQALDIELWLCLGLHLNCANNTNFNNVFNDLQSMMTRENIPARPYSHCLNQLKVGSFDPHDPTSYERLHPLDANFGCGGVYGRLTHDANKGKKVWGTGRSQLDSSPALIQES
jgi:hypothetical protein